jgi:hypothetical protein
MASEAASARADGFEGRGTRREETRRGRDDGRGAKERLKNGGRPSKPTGWRPRPILAVRWRIRTTWTVRIAEAGVSGRARGGDLTTFFVLRACAVGKVKHETHTRTEWVRAPALPWPDDHPVRFGFRISDLVCRVLKLCVVHRIY